MTPELEQYINEVSKHIKWRKARYHVECDVEEHLRTFYGGYIAEGMDHHQAVQATLDQIGAPEDTARNFSDAFRPSRAWELLPIILLFAACGLLLSGISGVGTHYSQKRIGLYSCVHHHMTYYKSVGCPNLPPHTALCRRLVAQCNTVIIGHRLELIAQADWFMTWCRFAAATVGGCCFVGCHIN